MEPGTGLAILGSAVGSAKLVEKILGPSTDYLGGELSLLTQKAVGNVKRIFEIAATKLGLASMSQEAFPRRYSTVSSSMDHSAMTSLWQNTSAEF